MKRPNIVLILSDQLRLDAIHGYSGSPDVSTPHLDRLMNTGTSFRKSICAYPLCCPSRASIFTGRMPCEHGNIANNVPRAEGIPNLGEWLGANSSYNCVYAGKWHVGEDGLYVGTTDGISGFLNLPCDTGAGMGDYGDPIIAHNASAFLSNYDEFAPYFLVVSFHNPHDICYWRTSRAGDWLIPDSRGNVNLNPLPDLPPNFGVNFREPEAFRKFETERRKYGDGRITQNFSGAVTGMIILEWWKHWMLLIRNRFSGGADTRPLGPT